MDDDLEDDGTDDGLLPLIVREWQDRAMDRVLEEDKSIVHLLACGLSVKAGHYSENSSIMAAMIDNADRAVELLSQFNR